MKVSPTERPVVPTKKSLRIWVKNNGHVVRKKERFTYVYPRTVEAAKDPFICSTGKNKMFFLIAINVFPDSKIIRPDNSDAESEAEETNQLENKLVASQNEAKKMLPCRRIFKKRTNNLPKKKPLQALAYSLEPISSTCNGGDLNDSIASSKVVNISQTNDTLNKLARARKRPSSKETKNVRVKSNENAKGCSRLILQTDTSLSEPDVDITENPHISESDEALLKKKDLLAIPAIANNWQKVIQTCSNNGVVSFSLSKKPRNTRS